MSFVSALFLAALCSAARGQDQRPALPAGKALEDAEQLLLDVHGDALAKASTPPAKSQLSKTLVRQARETQDDLAARYVLLRRGLDLAVAAGDTPAALEAAQALGQGFQLDSQALQADTFAKLAASVTSLTARGLAEAALIAMDDALVRDDYAGAEARLAVAQKAVAKVRDAVLLKRLAAKAADLAALRKAADEVQAALARLDDNPTDPSANLAVGKFLCFTKGDWDRGLPMLALGSEPSLKSLAELELSRPQSAADQAKLGDGWWEWAEKAEGQKKVARERAVIWYRRAAPTLTGLTKSKVDKRIEETGDFIPAGVPNPTLPAPRPARDGAADAAINRGLAWVLTQQRGDGSWTLQLGGDQGAQPGMVAATSLALICLVRADRTDARRQAAMKSGLTYLASRTAPNGNLLDGGTLYVQGLAALALCEGALANKDRKTREAAQAAVGFIIGAQDQNGGGWRYQPGQPGDTSVSGWQIAALHAGKELRFDIPAVTLTRAGQFLNAVQANGGSSYGYTGPGAGTSTTAIGLLSRLNLGGTAHSPAIAGGIKTIAKAGPHSANVYYTYYGSVLMQKAGGQEWENWRSQTQKQLLASQEKAGSWRVAGQSHGEKLGRFGETCLALMTLLVE